jgi:hypothetical protein
MILAVLLIPILMLMAGTAAIGGGVLATTFDAVNNAYAQAVAGTSVRVSDDPVPPAGIIAVRPDLPNRLVFDDPTRSVSEWGGSTSFSYTEKAAFLDPTWHLSGFPPGSASSDDHAMLVEWFNIYVGEARSPVLSESLGLRPPGPP